MISANLTFQFVTPGPEARRGGPAAGPYVAAGQLSGQLDVMGECGSGNWESFCACDLLDEIGVHALGMATV